MRRLSGLTGSPRRGEIRLVLVKEASQMSHVKVFVETSHLRRLNTGSNSVRPGLAAPVETVETPQRPELAAHSPEVEQA